MITYMKIEPTYADKNLVYITYYNENYLMVAQEIVAKTKRIAEMMVGKNSPVTLIKESSMNEKRLKLASWEKVLCTRQAATSLRKWAGDSLNREVSIERAFSGKAATRNSYYVQLK